MRGGWWDRLSILGVGVAVYFWAAAAVQANHGWVDQIANAMAFYQATYPQSNFDPYQQRLNRVRDAVHQGDQRTVKTEMGGFFSMLRTRAHGINDVAADELYNFAAMVTPLEEYGLSVPPAGRGR